MENSVIEALWQKWERDSEAPEAQNGAPEAQNGAPEAEIGNARADGFRSGTKECAKQLRELLYLLG